MSILAADLRAISADLDAVEGVDVMLKSALRAARDLAGGLDPYLSRSTTPESPALRSLADRTQAEDWVGRTGSDVVAEVEQEMLSGHVEGQTLKFLVYATRATRVLEIGMFTGYSALAMAEALPADGTLVACEIDPYVAAFAQECFGQSDIGRKITVEVGPAQQTLDALAAAGRSFDLVFIDADKAGYLGYLTSLLDTDLLAPHGVVCVDNTLMQGHPYLPGPGSDNGVAIAAFNDAVAADPRVEQVLIPLRDGITLIRRAGSPAHSDEGEPMNIDVLEPVGARVTDLPLRNLAPDEVTRLRALLAEHGVVVLPDQDIDDAEFVEFLRQFGDLMFSTGETPVADFPDLNVISNVARTTPPRSTFHVDTSYVRRPPAYTALRAVTVPAEGGATQFTNQYRAFDTLAPDVRTKLEGRTIEHVVTGLDLSDEDETSAEHPVFRQHPISGRTSLYLSTPKRCAAISGLDATETAAMVDLLFTHSTAPDNIYRHAWSPGDVVMWDNGCVLHRADHSAVVGDRVMHRGMVAGYDDQGGTTHDAG